MRIDNWSVTAKGIFDPYQPPEVKSHRLFGIVLDHPKHPGVKHITTSPIIAVNPVQGTVLTHSGSLYELGTVDPDYEAAYPNARNRLLGNG